MRFSRHHMVGFTCVGLVAVIGLVVVMPARSRAMVAVLASGDEGSFEKLDLPSNGQQDARQQKLDEAKRTLEEHFRKVEESRPDVKMKLIAEAAMRYNGENEKELHVSVGPDGRKGLSWRVWLLPHFQRPELDDLFAEFQHDEPWDSQHNLSLVQRMPAVYATTGSTVSGKSVVHAFVGPKTLMGQEEPLGRFGLGFDEFNTVQFLVARPDKAEVWTKPGGLPLELKQPFADLEKTDRGYLVSFRSGSVRRLAPDYPPEAFALQTTINHGQELKLNRLLSEWWGRRRAKQATGPRETGAAGAEHRALLEQMEKIAQAMLDCQKRLGGFPGAAYSPWSESSKSELSWRVHLLPFLGEEDLYSEFHWDEPWDSEHNKQFVDRMPAIYQLPSVGAGKTRLHVFTGAKTPLGGEKPVKDKFGNGAAYLPQTIMFVLGGPETATEWTRPGGVPFSPDNSLGALGATTDGGYPVVLFDGSVRLLPANTSSDDVTKLILHENRPPKPGDKSLLKEWRPGP